MAKQRRQARIDAYNGHYDENAKVVIRRAVDELEEMLRGGAYVDYKRLRMYGELMAQMRAPRGHQKL
jgi:hypothetical protein